MGPICWDHAKNASPPWGWATGGMSMLVCFPLTLASCFPRPAVRSHCSLGCPGNQLSKKKLKLSKAPQVLCPTILPLDGQKEREGQRDQLSVGSPAPSPSRGLWAGHSKVFCLHILTGNKHTTFSPCFCLHRV